MMLISVNRSPKFKGMVPAGFRPAGTMFVLLIFLLSSQPAFAASQRRIVSLAPGLTECLFVLGVGDSVVGITDFDRFPPEVRDLPSVGGYYDPSVEKILALSPELVVGVPNFHGPLLERLEGMGIATASFSLHRHLSQVREALEGLGALLGPSDRATDIWNGIEVGLSAERSKLAGFWKGQPPSVLVIVWTDPMTVAGGENYLDDILDHLNVPNAAGDIVYTFPQVDREKILALDPDVVIVARASEGMVIHAEDFIETFNGLPLRAIIERQVYELPADVLFHPGPRVLDAARLVVDLLTPERTGEGFAAPEEK